MAACMRVFWGSSSGGWDGGDPCKLRRSLTIFELPNCAFAIVTIERVMGR
jgi:hypothetical protein